jgi:aryl carrier-like protein/effector-binding domain-containing protein
VNKHGDKYLCGFLVSNKELSLEDIKSHLSSRIPEYMLPSSLIQVKEFPTTDNGKIDHEKLFDLESIQCERDDSFEEPHNNIEQQLVQIWKSILKHDEISIHDNFFVLGGNSIKVIQLLSKIEQLNFHLDIEDIFDYPTISQLSTIIGIKSVFVRKENSNIDIDNDSLAEKFFNKDQLKELKNKFDLEDIYPLSPMQEGILFQSLKEEGVPLYLLEYSYLIEGNIEIDFFEKSFNDLINRYDILRSNFLHNYYDRMFQVVLKERKVEFLYVEISSSDDLLDIINQYKTKNRQRGFDLANDVLMRAAIFKIEDSKYQFIWSFHHILMDGWCLGKIFEEFSIMYMGYVNKQPQKLLPVAQYKNYIAWLENQNRELSSKFWEAYLKDFLQPTSIPRESETHSIERNKTIEVISLKLDKQVVKSLNKLFTPLSITISSVIHSLWGILLSFYNDTNDVVFGTVVLGRPPELKNVDSIIGLFINTIPIRINFNKNESIKQIVKKVQEKNNECQKHHYYPLYKIQSESTLKQNLFDHMLSYANFNSYDTFNEDITLYSKNDALNYKLTLQESYGQTEFGLVVRVSNNNEDIYINIEYDSSLYSRINIEAIGNNITEMAELACQNPDISLNEISLTHNLKRYKPLLVQNDLAEFNF